MVIQSGNKLLGVYRGTRAAITLRTKRVLLKTPVFLAQTNYPIRTQRIPHTAPYSAFPQSQKYTKPFWFFFTSSHLYSRNVGHMIQVSVESDARNTCLFSAPG